MKVPAICTSQCKVIDGDAFATFRTCVINEKKTPLCRQRGYRFVQHVMHDPNHNSNGTLVQHGLHNANHNRNRHLILYTGSVRVYNLVTRKHRRPTRHDIENASFLYSVPTAEQKTSARRCGSVGDSHNREFKITPCNPLTRAVYSTMLHVWNL